MKKRIGAIALCLLVMAAVPLSAFAHNGGGHRGQYSVCTIENCPQTGAHKHNGTNHVYHWAKDGHKYYNGGQESSQQNSNPQDNTPPHSGKHNGGHH